MSIETKITCDCCGVEADAQGREYKYTELRERGAGENIGFSDYDPPIQDQMRNKTQFEGVGADYKYISFVMIEEKIVCGMCGFYYWQVYNRFRDEIWDKAEQFKHTVATRKDIETYFKGMEIHTPGRLRGLVE